MPLGGDSFSSKSIINPVVNAKKECMNYGILISSFTDGIEKPFLAKEFLKYSLSRAFAKDAVLRKEEEVRKSVLKSPCAGPNIEDLNDLEKLDTDAMVSDGEMFFNEDGENQAIDNSVNILLRSLIGDGEIPLDLRVLYIPTALYALKKDSKNTPGKQRQRARADGKKRRNAIVRLLGELFHKHKGVRVLAITLDLDDGSLKQPQGTEDMSFFPEGGEEALNSWRPHLIYVEGGNTFWLQHCIEKGNWLNQIKSACVGPNASAVYVGKSAGAIICGKNVETATWKGWDDPSIVPNKETYDDWIGREGLNIANGASFFPHMSSEWEELVQEKNYDTKGNENSLICLNEWEAYCIEGQGTKKAFIAAK
eukprot:CAMPEP_0184872648 /NCGR_PEP_ID=MMETSP0580-20130426/41406_1 /TAXON_ID=1118495 /ORGANISM="Dactyliosolen fragilissimus" /LENGTH=365 /DNA_ID=CAMNT_0027375479 /DNA_START=241 /DNA_END=1341 /DNA_ORIENTATION=+